LETYVVQDILDQLFPKEIIARTRKQIRYARVDYRFRARNEDVIEYLKKTVQLRNGICNVTVLQVICERNQETSTCRIIFAAVVVVCIVLYGGHPPFNQPNRYVKHVTECKGEVEPRALVRFVLLPKCLFKDLLCELISGQSHVYFVVEYSFEPVIHASLHLLDPCANSY